MVNRFVDIIVPTYNSDKYIVDCIESLINQSYDDEYKLILVDNGSKDKTVSIINKYANKSNKIVLLHQPIRSSYAARNMGIEYSSAKYCLFIDSDCVASKDLLKTYVNLIKEHSIENCVISGRIEMMKSKYTTYGAFDTLTYLNQELSSKIGIAATANLLVSKSIFNRLGLFDFNLISGGDVEFTKRIKSAQFDLIYLNNALVYHPIRQNFIENAKKSFRVGIGNGQIHKKNKQIYKILKPGIILNMIRQLRTTNHILALDTNIKTKKKVLLIFVSVVMQIINYSGRIYGIFKRKGKIK